jgi:hypothetical protein
MAVTIYGVCAVTFMMTMYALERRHPRFVLGFAFGCIASSIYGFLSGAWPFGVVELIWSGIAFRRYANLRRGDHHESGSKRYPMPGSVMKYRG